MGKKLTAVLIGAGGIVPAWLTPLSKRDDVEIRGIVEILPDRAASRIREFSLNAQYYSDLNSALAGCRPDLVFDCSLPSAHCANALAALRAGCHVLSEKPIAESVADVRRIIAAARAANRIHAVIQNRRYLPELIACRDAVRNDIGTLTTLNADFYLGAHFGGFRDEMEHVLLLDMAIHSFDEARFISGCDPVSVYCKEWNPGGSWYRHGASAMAIFTMSNGVIFNYRGSWCAEGCNTSWECDWRAVGTEGSVCLQNQMVRGEKVVERGSFISKCEPFSRELPELALTAHAGCIHEFIECVKNGGTPQTNCADNLHSLAMVEYAIRSAELNQEIIFE